MLYQIKTVPTPWLILIWTQMDYDPLFAVEGLKV